MARYNLCREQLSAEARTLAAEVGLLREVNNPFESIMVRSLETFYAFDEAIRLIEGWQPDGPSFVEAPFKAGAGAAATEAPRGLLFHKYEVDDKGMITRANIVPPTSQNQFTIEEDLGELVAANLSLPQDELTWRCEQAIRNYDPCISCATHFLNLQVNRE
jgi:coenzyme F420-reducing hydrogenase alpha subunit